MSGRIHLCLCQFTVDKPSSPVLRYDPISDESATKAKSYGHCIYYAGLTWSISYPAALLHASYSYDSKYPANQEENNGFNDFGGPLLPVYVCSIVDIYVFDDYVGYYEAKHPKKLPCNLQHISHALP